MHGNRGLEEQRCSRQRYIGQRCKGTEMMGDRGAWVQRYSGTELKGTEM